MALSKAEAVFAALAVPSGYLHCKRCCREDVWDSGERNWSGSYELSLHRPAYYNPRSGLVITICALCNEENIYSLDVYESYIKPSPLPPHLQKFGYRIKEAL